MALAEIDFVLSLLQLGAIDFNRHFSMFLIFPCGLKAEMNECVTNFCFSNSGDDDLIRAAFAFLRSCLESKRGEQVEEKQMFFFEVVTGFGI